MLLGGSLAPAGCLLTSCDLICLRDDRGRGGGGGFFGDLVGAVANEVIDNIQDDGGDDQQRRRQANQVGRLRAGSGRPGYASGT